jgi:hypothetical protein
MATKSVFSSSSTRKAPSGHQVPFFHCKFDGHLVASMCACFFFFVDYKGTWWPLVVFFPCHQLEGHLVVTKSIFSSSSTIRACNGQWMFLFSSSIKGAPSGHQVYFFSLSIKRNT